MMDPALVQERLNQFFAETPEPEGSIEEILDNARFEAAQRMDPTLTRHV